MPKVNCVPLLCLLLVSGSEAFFGYALARCHFTSPDDVVYLAQLFFNKMLLVDYNSTRGNYTGYTEKAMEVAKGLNLNPSIAREDKKNLEKCKTSVNASFGILSKTVEPSVRLRSAKVGGSTHPNMLICSVYSFFPKQINVTWLRNRKPVTSGVSSTEELPNGDWLYQLHSHLEVTPRSGDVISCMVEHASFETPRIYDWGLISEAERNKIAIGASGLLLGLVFMLVGLIYYKRSGIRRTAVPQTLPLED